MIGIDSKLYQIMTTVVEIVFLSILCAVIAIPLFTIPISILLYCQIGGNIVNERKLFHCSNLTKKKIIPIILYLAIGICSLYNSLMLTQMNDFFISRLIISLLISFNVSAGILVLNRECTFFVTMKHAFFYSVANFHKTVLPVFILIGVMGKLNGMLSGYAVAVITGLYCYWIFKINIKTIEKNFIERKADAA